MQFTNNSLRRLQNNEEVPVGIKISEVWIFLWEQSPHHEEHFAQDLMSTLATEVTFLISLFCYGKLAYVKTGEVAPVLQLSTMPWQRIWGVEI